MKEGAYMKKMSDIRKKATMQSSMIVPKLTKFQKVAMSKPVGKVLDSKVGKTGVKVGNKVIKAGKAIGKSIKKSWGTNQAFRNKNSTKEKYMESLK